MSSPTYAQLRAALDSVLQYCATTDTANPYFPDGRPDGIVIGLKMAAKDIRARIAAVVPAPAVPTATPRRTPTRNKCPLSCECVCHDTGGGDHPDGYCPGKDIPHA